MLALVCAVTFWWSLGRLGLTDPDEPFYAETAREMLAKHDWITPQIFGAPQFEKPILFYWLSMASFKLCGVNEFAARLPSALFASGLVFLTYAFGVRWFGRRAGFLAGLMLATSGMVVLMARLMLTDMVFAAFVSGALFCLWQALAQPDRRAPWLVAHCVCTALAVLTKGPLGSLIPLLAVGTWRLITRRPLPLRGPGLWWGLVAYAVIVVPWFGAMFWKFGWKYFNDFFIHENLVRLVWAEHPKINHIWFYSGASFCSARFPGCRWRRRRSGGRRGRHVSMQPRSSSSPGPRAAWCF